MFINVIRAEDNRHHIENKDYTKYTNNDDGTVSVDSNFHAMADRLWVREAILCRTGRNCIYEIKTESGIISEGWILEQGVDACGNYIVLFNFDTYSSILHNEERPNFPDGAIEINLTFSPDMISGGEELINSCNGHWPSFHEAMPKIVESSSESMLIRFAGGFLGYTVVDVKLTNIIDEKCDDGFIDNLGGHGLTSLEIRKSGEAIELKLYNDYITQRLPDDFDQSVFDDPDFDFDTIEDKYIEEEHISHWFITCEEIEMTVTIDEEAKRQYEERHEKFLRECRGEIEE